MTDPKSKTRIPLAMRPQGLAGRLFSNLMEAMNEPTYRDVLRLVDMRDDLRVLEIGFGTGRMLELLATANPSVRLAGLDPTPDMVKRARGRKALLRRPDADIRLGGAGKLDWPDGCFDLVLAIHSFQFWTAPAAALVEIKRVLAPEGRIILALRNHVRRSSDWLPNPISRSDDEWGGAVSALDAAGYVQVREAATTTRSRILQASRPAH